MPFHRSGSDFGEMALSFVEFRRRVFHPAVIPTAEVVLLISQKGVPQTEISVVARTVPGYTKTAGLSSVGGRLPQSVWLCFGQARRARSSFQTFSKKSSGSGMGRTGRQAACTVPDSFQHISCTRSP